MNISKTTRRRGAAAGILRLAEKHPTLRARDVAREGIHTSTLTRVTRADDLNRIARRLRVQRVMQPYLETVVM